MKLRGLFTLLLGAVLLGVGCTTDADIDNIGGNGEGTTNVNISATLPELGGATRGVDSARGGVANIDWDTYELRVIVKAYGTGDYAGQLAAEKVEYKVAEADANGNYQPISINLNIPLTSGHTYDIYLWADYVLRSAPTSDLHYNTEEFPTITLKGNNLLVINDETRDAFFGRGRAIVGDVATTWDEAFGVERAVAKLRMVATDAAGASATSATLQVEKLYTGFDITTGAPTSPTEAAVVSAKTAFETYNSEVADSEGNISKSFITTYMLWPAEESVAIVGSFYEDGNETPVSEVAPAAAIPFKRGSLTTLRGEMFDTGWDGSVETPTEIADDWLVINTPGELLWLATAAEAPTLNGTTYSKFRLGKDIDVYDSTDIQSLKVGNNATFDGNGKTISGFGATTTALFGSAQGLNAYNFTLEGYNVSHDGHIGVLVDELSQSATFTNITIKNSSATTTNGAAGGIVGYIAGGDKLDLNVTFTNCHLVGVKATGSLAEGKFVGLMYGYDNGEILSFDADCSADENCAVADYVSPYTEDNDAQWLDGDTTTYPKSFDFSKYNGWLGDEEKYRATVKFADHRMQIKWDGVKEITPITDDSGAILIYSPFDLASLQKQSPSSVKFKTNVDLGGDHATTKNKFNPIKTITNLDGEEHTLYNLYVDMVHDGTGAAFIQTSSGTTTHMNLTFDGAYIKNVHNTGIQTPAYGVTNDGGAGNAYAGTLVVTGAGTKYLAENIHVKNSTVYAVCKMGGIMGRATANNFDMINCSVDKCTIENYNPKVPNYYAIPNYVVASYTVNGLQWWHTCGEAGGLIGFVQAPYADIQGCAVTNTNIYCVGQPNKNVAANVYKTSNFNKNKQYVSEQNLFAKGYTKIAGRHFNQFIGNVVSQRGDGGSNYVVNITDYIVKGNYYGSESNRIASSSTNSYNHNYGSGYCEVVGCPYFVGVEINPIGLSIGHVMHHAGTLYFKAKETDSTTAAKEATVTEADSEGDLTKWIGGDFFSWEVQYEGIIIKRYPKSEYPNVNEIEGALENQ